MRLPDWLTVFSNRREVVTLPKNVLVGEGTRMGGYIDVSRAPNSKVRIGAGCIIDGNISMETDDAILSVGENVYIRKDTLIVCTKSIEIGSYVLISGGCIIQDSDNHSLDFEIRKHDVKDWLMFKHDWSRHESKSIVIDRGAWLGARVIVLKGVRVGEKTVVGAGSVVTKTLNPNSVYAGNPAQFIKRIAE